jgi:flagellar basal body-associated protein FliL
MAENETVQSAEQGASEPKPAQAGASSDKMTLIIAVIVAAVSAGGGYGISVLSANTSLNFFKPAAETAAAEADATKPALEKAGGKGEPWYYKLDPVVANLDEPGALRYIRLAVYLEMDGSAHQEECSRFIEAKKPVLTNWLQLYLAGRSLDEVKGEKYLKTMQVQILEGFNQILFPNTKSLIKGVLFGEINIQ